MKRILCWALGLTLLPFVFTACSKRDDCGGTAKSAEDAVSTLLDASVQSDADLACKVTRDVASEDLDANLGMIAEFVNGKGGLNNLSVTEDASRRMGSEAWVVVRVADSTESRDFQVLQSGGYYYVITGSEQTDNETDDLTADPNPPTTSPSTSTTSIS